MAQRSGEEAAQVGGMALRAEVCLVLQSLTMEALRTLDLIWPALGSCTEYNCMHTCTSLDNVPWTRQTSM